MTKISIGIDPGKNTGFAVFCHTEKRLIECRTLLIHEALEIVRHIAEYDEHTEVVIEDPFTWVPFRRQKADNSRLQGAGSVKRDFTIWKDFCESNKIQYRTVKLQSAKKKLPAKQFFQLTGWSEKSSVHARDAAMLVFRT